MTKTSLSSEEGALLQRYFETSPIKLIRLKAQSIVMRSNGMLLEDIAKAVFRDVRTIERETIPVLVKLDRGTEDQKFFRKRIRAYIVFLRSRTFETLFNIENITIAFATTKNHNRVKQMREWTQKELAVTNEPAWLGQLFLFTALPENMGAIEPRHLFLDPVWYVPSEDDNPVSLLGE